MADKIKILITSAGSTNGINIIQALKKQKELDFFIVATDVNILSAGFFLSNKHYIVPPAKAKSFIDFLIDICKKEQIKIIIPTFSAEIEVFAKNKERFEKLGIKVGVCEYKTILDTESKTKTNEWFKKLDVPFPKIYTTKEITNGKIKFPVIIKPDKSSGSKGVIKINNKKELLFYTNSSKNKIFIQEFAQGQEYTIDGLCNLSGKVIAVSPRVRIETKGGLAIKSITKENKLMSEYAIKIAEGMKIVGPFNIQCFEKNGKIKFIEINSRFPSGGLPLTVEAGFNIPLLFIKMLIGQEIKKPKIKAGVVMVRYWDSFFTKENKI